MINGTGWIAFCLLVSGVLVPAGCADEKFQGHWKNSEISVDGSSDDWVDYPVIYCQNNGWPLLLGIVNDDTTLNIIITIRDLQAVRSMEHRGFIIWLNGDGKKDKNYGIIYQVKDFFQPAELHFSENNKPDCSELPVQLETPPPGKFKLISGDTTEIPHAGLNGLQVQAKMMDGIYCCELSIPIHNGRETSGSLPVIRPDKIRLGIETLSAHRGNGSECGEPPVKRGDGPPEIGDGNRGPGPPPGGHRGGQPGYMSSAEKSEWWITLSLTERSEK